MEDRSQTVLPHHLIPPAARPATMRRWNTSTMMTSGTVMMTPAAIWEPNGVLNCEAPVNFDSKTVAGSIFGSLIMVTATRHSFHAPMKTMIAVVKMPGAASGRMILRKACAGDLRPGDPS